MTRALGLGRTTGLSRGCSSWPALLRLGSRTAAELDPSEWDVPRTAAGRDLSGVQPLLWMTLLWMTLLARRRPGRSAVRLSAGRLRHRARHLSGEALQGLRQDLCDRRRDPSAGASHHAQVDVADRLGPGLTAGDRLVTPPPQSLQSGLDVGRS